jgi:ubiquinone/menaquinone biosynthesis C-methylase UbiE
MMALATLAQGQVATEANRHYTGPEGRQRMISLLSAPGRADRLQAEKLVAGLELQPGDTVVDLGTGAGFLLPYLSKAVGSTGRVVAQDIHQDFLNAARKTAEQSELPNVEYVLGGEKTTSLQNSRADVIVTVDAFHHFSFPAEMLASIKSGLGPEGRFVIVDYYKDGFSDPDHIRADKPEVIQEIEAAGFQLVADREHVPKTQYMLVFQKKPITTD